ncbi:MAG: bifunctional oligoribonuclease/PAP phosphatase NrnA [Clostridia bacterium]|nr:bifunctional oligoribonuclease/PAP phosphatase NrnA [Clostridia bacterium]
MQEIAEKIRTKNNFLIVSHVNPDGDAIGSGMALKLILEKMGKKAVFTLDGNVPEKLSFMENYCPFTAMDEACGMDFDCAISVDAAGIERIGKMDKRFMEVLFRIVIDHHETNPGFGDLNYIDPVGATGLLIDDLRKLLGVELDSDIANLLYIAICTDTGNFSYQNTDERILLLASVLRRYGADIPYIIEKIYRNRNYGATKLIGRCLERLRLYSGGRIAISYVLLKDFEEFGALQEDTEELIDFLRALKGVEIAIVVKEAREKFYRLSFRSKVYANVAELASGFGGGGHIHASGGQIEGDIEEVLKVLSGEAEKIL